MTALITPLAEHDICGQPTGPDQEPCTLPDGHSRQPCTLVEAQ